MVIRFRRELEKKSVCILCKNLEERKEGLGREEGEEGIRRKSSRILLYLLE